MHYPPEKKKPLLGVGSHQQSPALPRPGPFFTRSQVLGRRGRRPPRSRRSATRGDRGWGGHVPLCSRSPSGSWPFYENNISPRAPHFRSFSSSAIRHLICRKPLTPRGRSKPRSGIDLRSSEIARRLNAGCPLVQRFRSVSLLVLTLETAGPCRSIAMDRPARGTRRGRWCPPSARLLRCTIGQEEKRGEPARHQVCLAPPLLCRGGLQAIPGSHSSHIAFL
jgi:hypothetical protein